MRKAVLKPELGIYSSCVLTAIVFTIKNTSVDYWLLLSHIQQTHNRPINSKRLSNIYFRCYIFLFCRNVSSDLITTTKTKNNTKPRQVYCIYLICIAVTVRIASGKWKWMMVCTVHPLSFLRGLFLQLHLVWWIIAQSQSRSDVSPFTSKLISFSRDAGCCHQAHHFHLWSGWS